MTMPAAMPVVSVNTVTTGTAAATDINSADAQSFSQELRSSMNETAQKGGMQADESAMTASEPTPQSQIAENQPAEEHTADQVLTADSETQAMEDEALKTQEQILRKQAYGSISELIDLMEFGAVNVRPVVKMEEQTAEQITAAEMPIQTLVQTEPIVTPASDQTERFYPTAEDISEQSVEAYAQTLTDGIPTAVQETQTATEVVHSVTEGAQTAQPAEDTPQTAVISATQTVEAQDSLRTLQIVQSEKTAQAETAEMPQADESTAYASAQPRQEATADVQHTAEQTHKITVQSFETADKAVQEAADTDAPDLETDDVQVTVQTEKSDSGHTSGTRRLTDDADYAVNEKQTEQESGAADSDAQSHSRENPHTAQSVERHSVLRRISERTEELSELTAGRTEEPEAKQTTSVKEQSANEASQLFTLRTQFGEETTQAPRETVRMTVNEVYQLITDRAPTAERTEFTVVLTPETLGRITVKMTNEGGRLSVEILTETEAAKQLFETRAEQLIENLRQSEVDVQSYRVAADDSQLFNESFDGSSKNPYRQQTQTEQDGDEEFAELFDQIVNMN